MPLSMCCSECQTIQCAEGSSADSSASAESSSFVFHCAKSGSFFNLQACLPVQCNAVPTLCMCSNNTRLFFIWIAIRRMEQWVVTHLSVRFVRVGRT